jgi:hypothetical protein
MKVLLTMIQVMTNITHEGNTYSCRNILTTMNITYGIMRTTSAKQTIRTFLPDRIDFNVDDGVLATSSVSPPIEFACAVI